MNLNEVTAYEVIQEKKLTDIRSTGYLLQKFLTFSRVCFSIILCDCWCIHICPSPLGILFCHGVRR